MKAVSLARASIALVLGCTVAVGQAATAEQWKGRSIYQVLTDRFARTDGSTTAPCNTADGNYCGGTYQGIIKKLDYIQNMGFTAIWISPITYNFPERTTYGYAWHGYWQQDLYRLNPNFGTAEDLKALSRALHDRGMYLMIDIVINHNGWPSGSTTNIQYTRFTPFNNARYYHTPCPITNWTNQSEVENCWIGDSNVQLPDLRTEDGEVARIYRDWVRGLIGTYGIDGLRIDTVKHVNKAFLKPFNQAAGVFSIGEVFNGDTAYVCGYQEQIDGVMNFPLYYPIISFLTTPTGTPHALTTMLTTLKSVCRTPSLMATFTENHDLPRFASLTTSLNIRKSALVFSILTDGIPIIYAGQEQAYAGGKDPGNREATWLSGYDTKAPLYGLIAVLNMVRNFMVWKDSGYLEYRPWVLWSDDRVVVVRKGGVVSVVSNLGESTGTKEFLVGNTGWKNGDEVVEVLTCARSWIESGDVLRVRLEGGVPKVLVGVELGRGSGICGL